MNPKEASQAEKPIPVTGPSDYEIATLAARICPGLCQQTPTKAVEIAMELMTAAKEAIQSKQDMDALEALAAKQDEEVSHFKFTPGVKFITGEQVMTRAMPWFRKFIRSRTDSDTQAEVQVAYRRTFGFGAVKAGLLQGAFAEWKSTAKTALAKKSAAGRKKKKRVRPKK
jgi:hypothetical protein